MSRTRRLFSLLLVLVMMIAAVPVMAQASTNGHSQNDAVNWANSKNGQSLDYDGVYGAQCVDLTAYYYQYLGASAYVGGNANAYQTRSIPNGWSRVYYSGGITFQPGDIAVWKTNLSWQSGYSTTSTGDLGHVGIILSADSVGFNAAEQNAGGKQYVTINWHYNSELYCVIRPDFVTSFTLDVNGYLDGQSWGGLGGSEFGSYGTCDVYINGTLVANDVGDYCQNHAPGTSYEIKDIKATTGHRYNGVAYINNIDRELKGTLNDNTSVRLNFTTDLGSDFYARIAKKNSSKNLEASSELTQEQQREGLNNLQLAKNGNDTTDPRQIWRFIRQTNGSYKIQNMYDNSVMDVYGALTDIPTNVITTTDDHGRDNQRWFISNLLGGYRLVPAHATERALDVLRDLDTNGANVCMNWKNESNAQIFSISKITYSKPAKPAASTVSVSKLGVPNSTTTLSWTASALKDSSFDHRSYTLYLTKDGSSYQTKTGLTSTSINLTLPKGTYTAKIRAINTKYFDYYTDGNTLTFTVKDCTTHTWNSGTVTKAATCTEAGVRTYTCTVNGCGASKTESIPALNHTTPNDDGNCTRCGTHLVDVEQHENPTNPTEPPAQQQTGACRWCGKTHGGIFGIFIGFFHTVLIMLFGAKY